MSVPIAVGVAGWSYDDWEGVVYDKRRGKSAHRLLGVASLVDVLELNSSFYRIPRRTTVQGWDALLRRHGLGVAMTVKVPATITHERHSIGPTAHQLLLALEPLLESARLQSLLAQFPRSFDASPPHRRDLLAILRALRPLPVVVELRHLSWFRREERAILAAEEISLAHIDMPGSGPQEELILRGQGPRFYLRLHGRNRSAWYRRGARRDQKYDYLYTPEQLRGWAETARAASESARSVHLIANNHFCGQAVANALQLRAMLTGEKVAVPPSLLERYPTLRSDALDPDTRAGIQRSLFDDER